MLILSRKVGESIRIGDDIVVKILSCKAMHTFSFGIAAPKEVAVHRKEYYERLQREAAAEASKNQPAVIQGR